MICFFTITIYHNLASHSLLTYCFYNKKRGSDRKILNIKSNNINNLHRRLSHQPGGIIELSFEVNFSSLWLILNHCR